MNRKERRAYAAKVKPIVEQMRKDAEASGVDKGLLKTLARQMMTGQRSAERHGNAIVIGPEKNG